MKQKEDKMALGRAVAVTITWKEIKEKLETKGSKNILYDADLNSLIDNADKVDGKEYLDITTEMMIFSLAL